jgi:hypothetical protein
MTTKKKAAPKKLTATARTYTDAERNAIIEGALISLATGQSLLGFCKTNKLPYVTVWDWLNPEDADNSAYVRAREVGTHYLAEECLDIADDLNRKNPGVPEGVDSALVEFSEDGSPEMPVEDRVKVAKVRIDTRLRLIGKWNQRTYGDKVTQEHTGPNGNVLPGIAIVSVAPPEKGDAS